MPASLTTARVRCLMEKPLTAGRLRDQWLRGGARLFL